MAKVGAQRAAELTGKSKSTIQRAMNNGKLSYEKDANDRRVVDVSELERVFGLQKSTTSEESPSAEAELQKATEILETERMKMRIRMLEDQLDNAKEQIEDLKNQRDQWQKQAQQVLLTSEYSQKQAEEYKQELQAAKERRQKAMEERMKKMKGDNQNSAKKSIRTVKSKKSDGKGFSLFGKLKSKKAAEQETQAPQDKTEETQPTKQATA